MISEVLERMRSTLLVAFLFCFSFSMAPAATDSLQSAQVISDLLDELSRVAASGAQNSIGFEIPDLVVDAYVQHLIRSGSRKGLGSARLKLSADNTVEAEGVVDLEQLERWEPKWFEEKGVLDGIKVVTLKGRFRLGCRDGKLQLNIVSLKADGISAETAGIVLRAIAQHQPEQFDIDKPLPLPYGLMSLSIASGVLHGKTR